MKDSLFRVVRTVFSKHPAVLASAALLLVAIAVASLPSARAAARHLITGRDIQNGSIASADLKRGSVNSGKLLDGHVLPRDLSAGLRADIARHATNGATGARGARGAKGDKGATGSAGPQGPAGPAAPTGTVTTVQLTDVGQDWTSHASAALDANGWVHLSGYLYCLGASGCADQMVTLPAGFESASPKEVFSFIAEQGPGATGAYSPGPSVIEVSPAALTVPDAASGIINGSNVWLSGITYKAAQTG